VLKFDDSGYAALAEDVFAMGDNRTLEGIHADRTLFLTVNHEL
jgi:hypothetical protein